MATTTGSVRDPAPTTPARMSTTTSPTSILGAPATRTHHTPRAALADREQAHFAPAADRDHAPRRASRAYRQSRPAGSAADDYRGRFYTRGGRRDRLAAVTPGLGAHLRCWSRARRWCRRGTWRARRVQLVSPSVPLTCTFLCALIAEVLVDVLNAVLDDSGIDEKFLGSRCSPLSRILQSS